MKHKKLIGLVLVVCIAITFIGVVNAQEVIVNGEKFNIPDSCEKDEENSNVVKTSTGTDENVLYNDEVNDIYISIMVSSVNSGQMKLPTYSDYENLTVGNINGIYNVDEYNNSDFWYLSNGKLVSISYCGDIELEDMIIQDTSAEVNETESDSGFPFNLF